MLLNEGEASHLFCPLTDEVPKQEPASSHRSPHRTVDSGLPVDPQGSPPPEGLCHPAGAQAWGGQCLSSVPVGAQHGSTHGALPPRPPRARDTVSMNRDINCLLCHPALILTFLPRCPPVLSPPPLQRESKANANLLTCSTHWEIQLK